MNVVYPYLGSLNEKEAEMIFTSGAGFNGLPTPEKPIFVLLFGTPGSGKSTAVKRMETLTGLRAEDAVQINLDSLVESLEPFREKTFKIASQMLKEKGIENANSASEKNVSEIAGKTSGPYLSIMRSKKNNRPESEGDALPYSLNELRFLMLEKALRAGKNILYERTVSDTKKDIFQAEVFDKIKESGKPYDIYIVYTKIDDESELRKRLRKRPLAMLKRNPPFFRGVPSSIAGKFIAAHEEYFDKYLYPRILRKEAKGIIVFSDGSDDLILSGGGGARKQTRRHKRKRGNKTRRTN